MGKYLEINGSIIGQIYGEAAIKTPITIEWVHFSFKPSELPIEPEIAAEIACIFIMAIIPIAALNIAGF